MTTESRKKIRLRRAAARLGISAAQLSRLAKPGGEIEKAGLTVFRPEEYPGVVAFYEDELFQWWSKRRPAWVDPEGKPTS